MSDARLIAEMTLFTRWADYLDAELAAAEVHERGCEQILEVMEAEGLIRNWDPSAGVNVSKAHSRVKSKEVRDARDQYQLAYARRKLVATMFRRAERGAALLSRELSRRGDMEPKQRRSDRYST